LKSNLKYQITAFAAAAGPCYVSSDPGYINLLISPVRLKHLYPGRLLLKKFTNIFLVGFWRITSVTEVDTLFRWLTPGSGMGKIPGGSGMNNPNHIFESLETIVLVKIL
jgi:hypothetical protein